MQATVGSKWWDVNISPAYADFHRYNLSPLENDVFTYLPGCSFNLTLLLLYLFSVTLLQELISFKSLIFTI